jgi:hypothetical protein
MTRTNGASGQPDSAASARAPRGAGRASVRPHRGTPAVALLGAGALLAAVTLALPSGGRADASSHR